jgi:DNA polymerase-3 subunit delta'
MIIWLPEFLGNNANSLLKILEEPTSNTIFILVAENKDKILNTVISRTQTYHIPPIDKDTISIKLSEEFKLEKKHVSWISNTSQGNYRKARVLSLEEDNINEKFIKDWLNICYTSKPVKLVDWSEKIAKESRINQIGFLQYTSTLLRQSILGYYGNIKANSQTEEKLSRSLIERIEFNGLEIFHNKISDSIMHIERNANAKILFLNLSLELSKLFKKRT